MPRPLLIVLVLVAGFFAWQEWGGGPVPSMSTDRSGSVGENHGAAQKVGDGIKHGLGN